MYKGYLIDLDGTIYLGDHVIPAGKRFIERLQENQIPFLFVTNNSSRLPAEVANNLANKFEIFVDKDQVYTSSLATRDYMNYLNKGKKVYVIGETGLKTVLEQSGYIFTDQNPDYVVVGLDKELTYEKLSKATLAISNGSYFIGTNPDRNIPTHNGLLPSNGPTIAYLECSTGVIADVVGKPNATMIDAAANLLNLDKKDIVMVGDNYDTDIKAGLNNHIPSLLVLSGFTKKEDLNKLPISPTHVVESLDDWNLS